MSLDIQAIICSPFTSRVFWFKVRFLISKEPKETALSRLLLSSCDQLAVIFRSQITIKETGKIGNIPGFLSASTVEYSLVYRVENVIKYVLDHFFQFFLYHDC